MRPFYPATRRKWSQEKQVRKNLEHGYAILRDMIDESRRYTGSSPDRLMYVTHLPKCDDLWEELVIELETPDSDDDESGGGESDDDESNAQSATSD